MSEKPSHEYLPHPRPYYPWVVWLLSSFFLFYIYLVESATLTIRPTKAADVSAFSNIWEFVDPYAFCIIIFQIPLALLIDKLGARKITSLAIVIFGFGSVLFGFSTTPMQIWASIFILGIGWSAALVNALKLAFNWFVPKQFALIAGLTVSISALGISLGQPIAHALLHLLGWRQMMIDLGIIGILYALIFFSLVRDSQPGARYSVHPLNKDIPFGVAAKKALLKGHNWGVALFYGLFAAPWITYIGMWHASFFQVAYNLSLEAATTLNIVYAFLFALGCPSFAYLSTRYQNRKRFLYVGVISALAASTCTIYIPSLPFPVATIFSMLTAFASGSVALVFPLIIERNTPLVAATVFGFAFTIHFVLKILFDYSTHALIHSTLPAGIHKPTLESFQLGFLMIPAFLLVSLVILFFIKETHAKQTYE